MKREIFLLKLFFFIYFSAWVFIFSFIPVYLREVKNFSIGMIGVLSAISSLSGALFQVYIGYLSDKFGKRKPFILIGFIVLILIYTFIFPSLKNFWSFLIVYFIVGIFTSTITTMANVLVMDYAVSERTGSHYASIRIWGSIGFLLVMLATGFYPKLVEPKVMFLMIGLIYLLGFILSIVIKESPVKTGISKVDFRSVKKIILKPEVRNFLIFYVIYFIALLGASSNVNLLIRSLGGESKHISFAYSASSFSEIPFMLIWGYLSDKLGRKPILIFTSIALPIRIFLYTLTNNPWHIILIQFMHSLTFAVIGTIPIVYMNDLVPPEERATAQGLLGMAMALSSTLGPAISGFVADLFGLPGMYRFLTFVSLISTVLAITSLKESKNRVSS
ncbi:MULTISPECIES: MFS transporter [Dictyoglomus]|uniref:MFS transporter n=1 Tax=Dictyoglomus TaxID=13 RepID=UPI000CCEB853|nr:MFS transporter [Dictyoglomus turgidum]PNV78693.1 MAG: MFS transporter [Dictyoglomus turgidum]PNV78739.1 MAG: MFS transporter [Dictyoglomus turgidum]PNV79705.1 MAG: MFS transporter [Dictyoglomus turgidum]PNV80078.1 MAG: MFS transporter [Dictyoglomus turgidum]